MEVLKKIELRDYQTYLYEDSSSLDEYWKKKEKKLKVLSNNEFLFGDEMDDLNGSSKKNIEQKMLAWKTMVIRLLQSN